MNQGNLAHAEPVLRIDGQVRQAIEFRYDDLAALANGQVPDVSQLVPGRQGTAVTLDALLQRAEVNPAADYLGLHSAHDDFHASIPLAAVRHQGLIIYQLHGLPLGRDTGGPFRFFLPNHDQCHTSEIDECANVKFVDRLELTIGKGFDNRPHDAQQHEALHRTPS